MSKAEVINDETIKSLQLGGKVVETAPPGHEANLHAECWSTIWNWIHLLAIGCDGRLRDWLPHGPNV